VANLQRNISRGSLTRDHIFYKMINNALSYAESDCNKTGNFKWDGDVVSFCNTLEYHGGQKVVNLMRGPEVLGIKVDRDFHGKITTFLLLLHIQGSL